jgi:hypothetical protein
MDALNVDSAQYSNERASDGAFAPLKGGVISRSESVGTRWQPATAGFCLSAW